MELTTFINSPVTQEAARELITSTQPADLGLAGAALLPEVVRDVRTYSREVTVLSAALIANDVAPLSEGVQKGGIRRVSIGGGLIDSGAKMAYDGEEIEMLRELVGELPGDTVRATMPELMQYLDLVNLHLNLPLVMNRERKRWTLLGTGRTWFDGARDDDFTKPASQNVFAAGQVTTVTTASGKSIYGGANANFFTDVRDEVKAARVQGVTIQSIWMNLDTLNAVLELESTRKELGLLQLAVNTGGDLSVNMSQGAATQDMLNSRLAALGLPGITVYDEEWSDQVRETGDPAGPVGTIVTTKYIPDGRTIYVPRPNIFDPSGVMNPTVPFRVATFDRTRTVGVHIIGRQTGKNRAGVNVYGPFFDEQNVNPNVHGNSSMAHMPFLNTPYGFRVRQYQKPA